MGASHDSRAHRVAGPRGRRQGRAQRKAQLLAVLRRGMARPSPAVFELNRLLCASPVDLGKVAAVVEADSALSRAVWEACARVGGTASWPGESLDEAIVLLGIDRFRFVASVQSLPSRLLNPAGSDMLRWFWRHSYRVACLSDRLGRWSGYFPVEHLFLAGLYHDLGMLPILEVVLNGGSAAASPRDARGDIEQERRRFGLDHCALGGLMGIAWDFPPAFIDVCVHHHDPADSYGASPLTRIVAAADALARSQDHLPRVAASRNPPAESRAFAEILGDLLPHLSDAQARLLAHVVGEGLGPPPGFGDPIPAGLFGGVELVT